MNQAPNVSVVRPADARQYLVNVAETLARTVVPAAEGKARERANECVILLARIAARLTAYNEDARGPLDALASLGDAAAAPARAVALDGAVLDAEERETLKILESLNAPQQAGQRSFEPERLQAYLRAHPLGSPSMTVTDTLPLQGGRSKLTVKVTQSGADRLPASFILRQDWASSVVGTSVVPEFEILRRMHAAGLRVPKPLLLEEGAAAMGAPFVIVGCIEGRAEGDIFDPPPSESLARDVAAQLGKLHAMGTAPFEGLPGIAPRAASAEQLRADLATYRGVIDQFSEPSPTVTVALDWLARTIDDFPGARGLVHGDLGFHNFLVHKGELAALLDWELAHLGHPAEDLGYARPWVERMIPWDRFVAAYRAAGGAEIDPKVVDFFSVWGQVRLYYMLLQARAAIVSGMLRDFEITMCSAHFVPYVLNRISRDMRRILGAS